MKQIAPSILSADFTKLGEEIGSVDKAGADWIHVDVMDGHFVPNISYGPIVASAARQSTALPVDVHLMIENPDRYIGEFAQAGADYISVHAETCPHLNRTIQLIREKGVKPGVALNPATPLDSLNWILEDLDFVLIMSVNPGFGGQKFIPNSLERIRELRKMIDNKGLSTLIQVDGGVCAANIGQLARSGADVFVAGSAIFGTENYTETIAAFRKSME